MNILDKCSMLVVNLCKIISNWLVSISKKIITCSHFLSSLQISKEYLKRRQREKPWYRDDGDERYLLDYSLNQESLVVEVGGHRGFFSSNIVCKFGCQLVIYEPLHEFVKILRRKFQFNEKVKIYEYGLGGSTRDVQIKLDDGGSSLFNILKTDITELIHIEDVVLDFSQNIKVPIDLLSVNIEGAEYEFMLALANSPIINTIKAIQIQFHEIDSYSFNLREEIRKKLQCTHEEKFCYEWVWEAWTLRSS